VSFFTELKRRNVFKVGVAYAIVAWLLIQITATVLPTFDAPRWVLQSITFIIILGFPLALFLAWVYELTPEGIKATTSEGPAQYHTQTTGQRLNYFIIGVLVLAVALLMANNYVSKEKPEVVGETSRTTAVTKTAPPEKAVGKKSEPAAPANSIAVLPFKNMSSDPEQEYFADGLTEELLNKLAQVQALQVTARTSSFYFKGKNIDMREVGEKLGVAYLLEGSVRKSKNTLRITAQLNDAATGYHLWSETYDRPLDEIFTIQDEIATAVVNALEISLGVAEWSHLPGMTRNVQAYDLLLKARALQGPSPDRMASMIKMLEEAVRLDPKFASAWNSLGDTYNSSPLASQGGFPNWEANRDHAWARARELAPDAPYVLNTMADQSMNLGDWIEADRILSELEAAAARYGISESSMTNRAQFLAYVGRCRESLVIYKLVLARDPLNKDLSLTYHYSLVGDLKTALAEADRVLALGTTLLNQIGDGFVVALATHDRAEIEKRFAVMPKDDVIGQPLNSTMMTLLDNETKARETLHNWLKEAGYQTPFHHLIIAQWAAYYGDTELALEVLKSLQGRLLVANFSWRPLFKDMRKLPGFKDLMRDIGLVDYWRTTGNWGDFCHAAGEDDFECE